jgi:hypothetical protein
VSPVRYELGFYILEDAILHSHRRVNLISYIEFCAGFRGKFLHLSWMASDLSSPQRPDIVWGISSVLHNGNHGTSYRERDDTRDTELIRHLRLQPRPRAQFPLRSPTSSWSPASLIKPWNNSTFTSLGSPNLHLRCWFCEFQVGPNRVCPYLTFYISCWWQRHRMCIKWRIPFTQMISVCITAYSHHTRDQNDKTQP